MQLPARTWTLYSPASCWRVGGPHHAYTFPILKLCSIIQYAILIRGPNSGDSTMPIGIEGTMSIEELERVAFRTATKPGRLEYAASSGTLCSRDSQTRIGVAPTIDSERLPAGHRVFTLLDTVSST